MNNIVDLKILKLYKNKRLKIGILGGSFDPPHAGHKHISSSALFELNLDEIWLALSPQNPLKPEPMFSYEDRLLKLDELVGEDKNLKILTIENEIKTNLTADLFAYLNKTLPTYEFVFIIGADIAPKMHEWEKLKELLDETNIVIFSRARYSHMVTESEIMKNPKYRNKVKFIPIPELDISSTEIRQKENDKKH